MSSTSTMKAHAEKLKDLAKDLKNVRGEIRTTKTDLALTIRDEIRAVRTEVKGDFRELTASADRVAAEVGAWSRSLAAMNSGAYVFSVVAYAKLCVEGVS